MIKIEVANMQDGLKVNPSHIKKVVKSVLKDENVENAEVSVALVDNERMAKINGRYCNRNYPTDVLAFPLETDFDGKGTMLADIIASCEMASERARELDISPQAEVMFYIVHGLLHILGYDDATAKKRRQMDTLQRTILREFGYELEK